MGGGLLQPGHLLVIVIIVLLLFGPGKLPELGNALGSGLRELRRALNTDEEAATPAGGPRAESLSASTRSPCQGCGAVSRPQARYCTQCGQKLAA
jgi:sec-independent protein translocase protein TatA